MTPRTTLWSVFGLLLMALYLASSGIGLLVDFEWFRALGFTQVYTTILFTKIGIGAATGVVFFVFLYLNLMVAIRQVGEPARYLPPELQATPMGQMLTGRNISRLGLGGSALIGLLAGLSGAAAWENWLLFLHGESFGQVDPIFGRDVSFYVFTLPFIGQIQSFVWSMGILTLLAVGMLYFFQSQAERPDIAPQRGINLNAFSSTARLHIGLLVALLLVVLAVGVYLQRFTLLHQPGGLFTGPGYADIHGTLPILALKSVTALVCAGIALFGLWRQRYRFLIGAVALLAVVWIGGNIYTGVLQRFVVAPNELEKERLFLGLHVDATNKAYALDTVLERQLDENINLTAQDIARNKTTINNIRLWDHEPLLDTFAQIQEIRTYYEFVSVDNDRYLIDGELRQTMLSPREISTRSLPSRTWVNERLTFTHGYGLTLGPVNRVNEQGLPVLYVQDLPPKTEVSALEVTRPEIYYGEIDNEYVFVRTKQQEFNYPAGDANIFSTYEGTGGVEMGTLLKRLLFALNFRDVKILLAEDFSGDTRVMFRRNIFERVTTIAPFLQYDKDPYLVIDEGRLMWVLDAYTTSNRYPYSEVVPKMGNYIRNPVKVVVDAYNGSVTFYVADPKDPIAKAYRSMFPDMMKPMAQMPASLRAHVRHPVDYFSIQTMMYATYHMRDVNTFYNKEDQWEVPVIEQKQMEPYFTVMRLPGESKEEFILMLPFTPRLKDNMAAWMVARSDGDHYGELVVYTFPKQKLVFGPKQMVARINQDSEVSQQITLWDQSGSNVIRGTLLVIPVQNSLIYIQPLYLRAKDGRIPELKRVIVGYQNEIAMGIDLDDALRQIFGSGDGARQTTVKSSEQRAAESLAAASGIATPAAEARRLYDSMQRAAREGDWARYGRELEALGAQLELLERAAK